MSMRNVCPIPGSFLVLILAVGLGYGAGGPDEAMPWPKVIPAPAGMEKSPGPRNDLADTTVWPNRTSRANSDVWIAANHDRLRQMRPRLLLINFSNEHSRDHLDRLTKYLIKALGDRQSLPRLRER